MFRKLAIAVITAWAALLETVADAIAATLPPPAAGSPRLRVVTAGRLCLRLLIVSPPPRLAARRCRLGRCRRGHRRGWRVPMNERDGWLPVDDPDEYGFMACRWPVIIEPCGRRPLGRGPPRGRSPEQRPWAGRCRGNHGVTQN